ncbi:MAG TPA: CpsB/CapC family capsule biosynthesis tyrosine phosphatase [Flavisolibacter sp.]|nr:CpsB/CapC family capsule biosynthesis tyrosine phosphatase [Flavisolibacter sp.]
MLFFSKKKPEPPADLSWLHTDMHSHLLPGIDDGSPDLATSLELVKGLAALGYKKLITTPHILWEMYPNTAGIITNGLEVLRKALQDAGITIELHAAAEYFIDDHFDRQLRNKEPLLTLSGNMVLVEFSMLTTPMDLQEILFEMQLQNYQPVLAHPERYTYLARRKQFFDELKNAGCLFQLNLLSLGGHYGTTVQELADHLLKNSYYDLAGTDLHHARHLDGLRKLPANQLKRLRDSGLVKNHLL